MEFLCTNCESQDMYEIETDDKLFRLFKCYECGHELRLLRTKGGD
jgi:predicted RNA-binding Zn-ribbon protein involved in translation (DUF1610 family)